MKQFFKYVLATIVGVILSGVVIIFLFIGIMTAMVSSIGKEKEVEVKENSVLKISLPYPIQERTSKNPFGSGFGLPSLNSNRIGLNDILQRIKMAKNDDKIKGIYLETGIMGTSFATLEEIRNALIDFKSSDKFVISYSELYSQPAYYLASVSDSIFINPEGLLEFKGFSSQTMFFKGTLEKLGIQAQVIKVGTFKSAVEPFILDKMSDANRMQVASYLGSIYDHFIEQISAARNLPADSLYALADQLRIQTPEDAVKAQLADAVYYKDQVLNSLKTRLKIDDKKDVNAVTIEKYNNPSALEKSNTRDRIAVVYADGEIVSGEGSDDQVGSEKLSRTIRMVRRDDKVKAVVLRVNSPGGSALASDVIWREVALTQKTKPIIVSMGDVAASGGYYIACAADSIFAQPNTLTGSIGVFGIIPNLEHFFNDKLGVTFDVVKTAAYSDLGTLSRPLTQEEYSIIQQQVNQIYHTFTSKVAEGRSKDRNYIDSIGQGRVWTGQQAQELGLVDGLGGIDRAIDAAAKKAGIKEYKLVSYPGLSDPFQSILGNFTGSMKTWFVKRELAEYYPYFNQARQVLEQSGIQARVPYTIYIN